MQTFDFEARGRKYTVTTEQLGTALTMNGHWLYEPSVLFPSPLTGNKYVLLLNRNKVSGSGQTTGSVITARISDDPINFGPETIILDNSDGSVDNICDMISARPIWDGSQWHPMGEGQPYHVWGLTEHARDLHISQRGWHRWRCLPCAADCNEDGILNTLDFICYLNYYNDDDPAADCNADNIVNTLDFLCFLNAYNEGC